MFKIKFKFTKGQKNKKIFFVSEIVASKNLVTNFQPGLRLHGSINMVKVLS